MRLLSPPHVEDTQELAQVCPQDTPKVAAGRKTGRKDGELVIFPVTSVPLAPRLLVSIAQPSWRTDVQGTVAGNLLDATFFTGISSTPNPKEEQRSMPWPIDENLTVMQIFLTFLLCSCMVIHSSFVNKKKKKSDTKTVIEKYLFLP